MAHKHQSAISLKAAQPLSPHSSLCDSPQCATISEWWIYGEELYIILLLSIHNISVISQSIKLSYRDSSIVLLCSLARRSFVELWLVVDRGWWLDFDWAIRDMQNWKLIDPLRRMAIKIHFLSNCHQLISSTFSWLQMCPLQIPMQPMNLFDAELYAIVWKWNSHLQDDGGGGNRNKHFIILF